MTADEFQAALVQLGISNLRFGRLLKVNKDTPTNYAKGETKIPGAVQILVHLLSTGVVTIEQLEAIPVTSTK